MTEGANTLVTELVGVYDADGGIVEEAKYVVGHLLGRLECALCDVTHGPVWRKKSFDAFRERLGVPFVVVYRNDRSYAVEAATLDELERGLHHAVVARCLALPSG